LNYLINKIAFWRRERWRVDVHDGMDDIALALTADAWSRTGRVSVEAACASGRARLRSGMVLIARADVGARPRLPLEPALKPMQQFDRTLSAIGQRFGASRVEWVALEMEYAATNRRRSRDRS
jgi:hypothetical protein